MTVAEHNLAGTGWRRWIAPEVRDAFRTMRSSRAAARSAIDGIHSAAGHRDLFARSSPISCATTPGPYYGRILSYPEPR